MEVCFKIIYIVLMMCEVPALSKLLLFLKSGWGKRKLKMRSNGCVHCGNYLWIIGCIVSLCFNCLFAKLYVCVLTHAHAHVRVYMYVGMSCERCFQMHMQSLSFGIWMLYKLWMQHFNGWVRLWIFNVPDVSNSILQWAAYY